MRFPRSTLALALLASGCLAPPMVFAPPTGDEVTVFVHGYKGSRLDTASGEVAWLTPGAAFSSGTTSLAYVFEGQRDFSHFPPLTPNGTLTKLTVIPGLIEEDAYLSFMRWGRDELPGFVAFAYDWRQDVRTSGEQLCAFIDALGPTKRVRLVVHSMGGLVTMHCLRHGPEAVSQRVTKVVFLGAAFGGAPSIFDDLLTGSTTGSNRALLSAETLLTLPSSWQLLPRRADFTLDATGAPVDVFASADAFHWGLFGDPDVKGRAPYRAELAKRLEQHEAHWAELLDGEPRAQSWKALAVVGTGRPTQAGWKLNADGQFDVEHPVLSDGDGLIVFERAHPWPSIQAKVIETTAEHSGMLRDPRVMALVRGFLSAAP